MRTIAKCGSIVAVFGLMCAFGVTGCGEENSAGGNEAGVMDKTEGGKGTVGPDAPTTQEDYYNRGKKK